MFLLGLKQGIQKLVVIICIDNRNTTTPLIYGEFFTDKITINGLIVINEQSANEDFGIESENNTQMLFFDASADQVMVGSSIY